MRNVNVANAECRRVVKEASVRHSGHSPSVFRRSTLRYQPVLSFPRLLYGHLTHNCNEQGGRNVDQIILKYFDTKYCLNTEFSRTPVWHPNLNNNPNPEP